MRKVWLATVMGLIATPVIAHDFWLQPRDYSLSRPGSVPLTMFVGHGPARDRWGVDADRVVLFRTIGPDGVIDHRRNLTLGSPRFDATVPLPKPGSYIVALQSALSKSQLPALRFNDYVEVEGITPIAAERKRRGQEQAEGREVYSRRAKAIVQVGPVDPASVARVTRPVNLRLEIVPARHPRALGKDGIMPIQVLFKGRPLTGALVKLTDLAADGEPVAMRRTGADGRTAFRLPQAGEWQMNVVWAEPLRNKAGADFQTTFSSLTFETVQ